MSLREGVILSILVVFTGKFIKAGLTSAHTCVEFVFTRSLNILELLSHLFLGQLFIQF